VEEAIKKLVLGYSRELVCKHVNFELMQDRSRGAEESLFHW